MNALKKLCSAQTCMNTTKMFASGRWYPQPNIPKKASAFYSTSLEKQIPSNSNSDAPLQETTKIEKVFPVFAPRRGLPDGRKVYSLVPAKNNELIADYVLFEDSMAKNKVPWVVYNAMTAEEKVIYMEHYRAIQDRKLTYVCPETKKVFKTLSKLLYDQKCCGEEECRHCPYELVNCSDQLKKTKIWNGSYYV